jgi:hypothetical protein
MTTIDGPWARLSKLFMAMGTNNPVFVSYVAHSVFIFPLVLKKREFAVSRYSRLPFEI